MPVSQPFSFLVQWHLTERCNLACAHCYQEDGRTGEMDLREIKEVIVGIEDMLKAWTDAYEIDVEPSFNITGGEPFLREDLSAVLRSVIGSGREVHLLTNGTLLSTERARDLAALGISGVQVSLEGPRTIHESVRGKGSFFRSLKGVECLVNAGVPVTLNVTLSRINSGSFAELVDLASGLGVRRLGFSRLVPSGRGTGLLDMMLTPDELKTAYDEIFSHATKDVDIVTGDPVVSCMTATAAPDGNQDIPTGGCAAGVSGFTLLSDGHSDALPQAECSRGKRPHRLPSGDVGHIAGL